MPRSRNTQHSSPGVWSEATSQEATISREMADPGCRRRRALAILLLIRHGFKAGEIATWLGISDRRVRQLLHQAERFGGRTGYSDSI